MNGMDSGKGVFLKQRGITLIEALVSLTIVLISATGLVRLQMESARLAGHTRASTEARGLLQKQLESLRHMESADAYGAGQEETIEVQGTRATYRLAWEVSRTALGSSYEAEVSASWSDRIGGHRLHLNSTLPAQDPADRVQVVADKLNPG